MPINTMIRHAIKVGDLRALLAELNDDDVLVPNEVRNLRIERNAAAVGFVDLLEGHARVELWHADDVV